MHAFHPARGFPSGGHLKVNPMTSVLRASSPSASSERLQQSPGQDLSTGRPVAREVHAQNVDPDDVARPRTSNNKQNSTIASIFGRQMPGQISLMDQVLCDGGARFVSPCIPGLGSTTKVEDLPVMVYFPGADGTGLAVSRQFPSLAKSFEMQALIVPVEDATPFEDLVDFVQEYFVNILRPHANGRPVYILGESFGALLAIALAPKCKNVVDRIVLVNPATSFEESIWPLLGPLLPQVPNQLFPFVPYAFAPFFGNPIQLLMRNIDLAAAPDVLAGQLIEAVLELFGSLDHMSEIFSPERVGRRFELIKQGVEYTKGTIPKVQQRVLLLASEQDWMLPSGKEAKRLESIFQRCSSVVFDGRSHALLQEAGIDLPQIMKNEGFYVSKRRLSVPVADNDSVQMNNFGTPGPIELPTELEVRKATPLNSFFESLWSPVFFSTKDGKVVQGFEGLPSTRPILFVGNHQFMGLDTSFLITRLLKDKGFLLRGLAHPIVSQTENRVESLASDEGMSSIIRLLTTFGAVPVNGKNMYKLLKQKENILLYPGGAREALKLRDEKYQVIWPEKSEFVRMAAKFGATIVPVASIGVEDSMPLLLDSRDILNIPFVGDAIKERSSSYPQARKGVNTSDVVSDFFVQPINGFGAPQRIYFLMQAPIHTFPSDYNDRDKCDRIYEEVKSQLEEGLSYLIEKREDDPYKDFLKRCTYEATRQEQAPTFIP